MDWRDQQRVHTPLDTDGSIPFPLPISKHDKIEEINASAMGVDDHYDKLDNLCLSY